MEIEMGLGGLTDLPTTSDGEDQQHNGSRNGNHSPQNAFQPNLSSSAGKELGHHRTDANESSTEGNRGSSSPSSSSSSSSGTEKPAVPDGGPSSVDPDETTAERAHDDGGEGESTATATSQPGDTTNALYDSATIYSVEPADDNDDDDDDTEGLHGPQPPTVPSRVEVEVKLFKQVSQSWEEQMLGIAVLENQPNLPLTITSSTDGSTVRFELRDASNFASQSQSIITWVHSDQDTSYAIAMNTHFSDVVAILQQTHFINESETGEGDESDDAIIEDLGLPKLTMQSLQVYSDFTEELISSRTEVMASQSLHSRSQLNRRLHSFAFHIIGQKDNLFDVFKQCDELEDEPSLHTFYNIALLAVLACDSLVFEPLISSDNLEDFLGMFEHPPNRPSTEHREHMENNTTLVEIAPLDDDALKATIKQVYFLTYLKDVILAGVIDDFLPSFLDQHIVSASQTVAEKLFARPEYIASILSISKDQNDERTKKQAKFLLETFTLSALQPGEAPAKYRLLADKGLYDLMALCARSEDNETRRSVFSAILKAIETNCQYVQRMVKGGWSLLSLLSQSIYNEKNIGTFTLQVSCLRLLLDFDDLRDDDADPSEFGLVSNLVSDFFGSEACFVKIAALFLRPIKQMREDRVLREKLVYILELISEWVPVHKHHIRNVIAKRMLLHRFARVAQANDTLLTLALARCFSRIIQFKNAIFINLLVKEDCLQPLMDAFEKNRQRNNMFHSTMLALINFIAVENIGRLRNFLVQNYRQLLASIEDHDCGEKLIRRFEQRMDDTFGVSDLESAQPNSKGLDRYNVQEGLSRSEELYFSEDDEDPIGLGSSTQSTLPANGPASTSHLAPTVTALSTNTGPPPPLTTKKSLVDYDDDDDEDEDDDEDGFLAGAHEAKKPRMTFQFKSKLS